MKICLWRLGHLDKENVMNSIIPSRDQIERLKNLINNNKDNGVLNIIWGPDISLEVMEVNEVDINHYIAEPSGRITKV